MKPLDMDKVTVKEFSDLVSGAVFPDIAELMKAVHIFSLFDTTREGHDSPGDARRRERHKYSL